MEQVKTSGTVGIIGAMASEVALLTARMENAAVTRVAGIDFYAGMLEGAPAVVAQCGIGKVCAALCAQVMIDRFEVKALVNTGVAGGLAPSLAIGDIVIAADAVQHDFDITSFGHVKGYLGGGDGSKPTRFRSDPALVASFRKAAESTMKTGKTLEGTIASGDVFVADEEKKREIASLFGAAATEMEGAAIAQTACANGVPFVIVRAISDLAGGEANVSFDEFEKAAAETSAAIVAEMLRRGEGLPGRG
mgnify:CR=1 FL=1